MLSSTQVKELFEKEAVLFGVRDGVLTERATELFGIKQVRTKTTRYYKDIRI